MATRGFDATLLERLLDAVGAHLEAMDAQVSIVVVGGAALALRGWVPRTTHDVDVIALASDRDTLMPPPFPEALVMAVERVARDFQLPDNWLNDTVAMQWRAGLPEGMVADLEWRAFRNLHVGLAGRATLIALKLFAAADAPCSVHGQDLVALAPSDEEVARAERWVLSQDTGAEWPQLVSEVVEDVRARRPRG